MTPWITKPVPFNIGQGAAAAAEATCSNTPAFDDLTGNVEQAMHASNLRLQQGCKAISGSSLIGQKVSTATIRLFKKGTPTGTATVKIYSDAIDGSALSSVLETSSTNLDVSTLPVKPDKADFDFEFSGSTTIEEDNAIILVYTSTSSDTSNWIANNMGTPGSPVENTTFNYQKGAGAAVWESETGFECRVKLCG